VYDWPGFTFPSRPEKPGTYEPSELGLYSTPWKCIEWGARRSVSRFLKWIRSVSPTRARISGPGMRSPSALSRGAFAIGFFQCAV
jgi:hypothetical protein